MADITVNYEGSTIATRSASGTTTLLTQGKYCTDDIEIVYVQPSGGGTVQTGTITGVDDQELTIPVNGTVSGIVIYTEDYSTGLNYENVCISAISGYGYYYVGLASALTPTRGGSTLETNYAASNFVTFASGSVVLRPRCTGSANQKWITGATYKWAAW